MYHVYCVHTVPCIIKYWSRVFLRQHFKMFIMNHFNSYCVMILNYCNMSQSAFSFLCFIIGLKNDFINIYDMRLMCLIVCVFNSLVIFYYFSFSSRKWEKRVFVLSIPSAFFSTVCLELQYNSPTNIQLSGFVYPKVIFEFSCLVDKFISFF